MQGSQLSKRVRRYEDRGLLREQRSRSARMLAFMAAVGTENHRQVTPGEEYVASGAVLTGHPHKRRTRQGASDSTQRLTRTRRCLKEGRHFLWGQHARWISPGWRLWMAAHHNHWLPGVVEIRLSAMLRCQQDPAEFSLRRQDGFRAEDQTQIQRVLQLLSGSHQPGQLMGREREKSSVLPLGMFLLPREERQGKSVERNGQRMGTRGVEGGERLDPLFESLWE